MSLNEEQYENYVIGIFQELGYSDYYGPDIDRDYTNPFFESDLLPALRRINDKLPESALVEAIYKITDLGMGNPIQRNEIFTDYLQNGVTVKYFEGGEEKNTLVYLIDYKNIKNNRFAVINQWTIVEFEEKRPDIVVFVNGLPLSVIELKSPVREDTDIWHAYRQIKNYIQSIPSLFYYNSFCVIGDYVETRVGTLTSDEDRFVWWRTVDGNNIESDFIAPDVLFRGMFEKEKLLDILRNFICFSKKDNETAKIIAGYHQYFAVKKAVESTKNAVETNGKAGIFWHTQGSGKSLSMVFYSKLLQNALQNPTIVVLTDRNDLDDQLFGQFSKCSNFLRQIPQQAENKEHLKELLAGRQANGIFFTTMQKFEEANEALSDRKNIIVIADEAHRSQYGLEERINPETGKVTVGSALKVRQNLPNATFIGFTGTPISAKDRSTTEIFGNYIDIYDMTQAVVDEMTRPVYYESRVVSLHLDEKTLQLIDQKYDIIAEASEPYVVEKSKHQLGTLESVLGAPETIRTLCKDIINHYEDRQYLLTGKAMIVAYSRPIAIRIYKEILEQRPEWTEKVKVVMTSDNNDPEEWKEIIGPKKNKEKLAFKFKDNTDPMKIAIVVDMWLTGFDVPSLGTMYIYKPMHGHTLMQAIARVNRVFKDKEGGLIVDYAGIARALKEAMNDYTVRDRKNYGNTNVDETAYVLFKEKLDICRDLMHGYDYSAFKSESDKERADCITGGANFLLKTGEENEEKRKTFVKEVQALKQARSLSLSRLNGIQRREAAYFEAIRTILIRFSGGHGRLSIREINDQINELLKQSIKSEGVINLFSDVQKEFSLFDTEFLLEISKMKERNLAVEMLKKLIADQIRYYQRTNLVKSEKFSVLLQNSVNGYLNGMLTNEEIIEELLKLAKEIKQAHEEGDNLGLTSEELAFYDALTKPEAVKDFYENDELVAITKELTELLQKNQKIDWQKKESARAEMRRLVKRLLKDHRYPPDGLEYAIETVIKQCEQWTDNIDIAEFED
ncbi:hypothetical protein MmiAt1_11180 [Methanimicrococcus sp. At1]|uniref:type I site-specific deoxyribonuclease n=1 Tax=Methanimicrococcus hacksteinii TaxID=3028293 RepID=A0ABU3VQF5_9EURY|nr:type I restriction endonuclease subunit R [Methanimicrococcus sp. At1]MDV0445535.1 hypothetical protein [Methanimicrococcus sp. At1]